MDSKTKKLYLTSLMFFIITLLIVLIGPLQRLLSQSGSQEVRRLRTIVEKHSAKGVEGKNLEEVLSFANRNGLGILVEPSDFHFHPGFLIEYGHEYPLIVAGKSRYFYETGLQHGDMIQKIDDVTLKGLTTEQLIAQFYPSTKKVATFTIQRGTEVITVPYQFQRNYDNAPIIKNSKESQEPFDLTQDSIYMKIFYFDQNTLDILNQIVQQKNQYQVLELDLSQAVGINTSYTTYITSLFFEKNTVLFEIDGAYGVEKAIFRSNRTVFFQAEEYKLTYGEQTFLGARILAQNFSVSFLKKSIGETTIINKFYGFYDAQHKNKYNFSLPVFTWNGMKLSEKENDTKI